MFISTMNESQRTETTQMTIKWFIGRTDVEVLQLKLYYFGHQMGRADTLEKILLLGKSEGRRRRGRQDEMVGWHHGLNGHEFEQAPWDGEGHGTLECCSPWSCKESDMTEQLNNKKSLNSFFPRGNFSNTFCCTQVLSCETRLSHPRLR